MLRFHRGFAWASLTLFLSAALVQSAARRSWAQSEGVAPPASAAALQTGLKTNLDYAEQWLARDDFASLRQTAGDLAILTEALDRESDAKAWREQAKSIDAAVSDLGRAAGRKDKAAAVQAIEKLKPALAGVQWQGGSPHSQDAKPKGSSRALMHLVEAVLADAKTAAAVGDLDAAKEQARVLSISSRLLAHTRDEADWAAHADGMAADALRAAAIENDAKAFRAALAAAAKRCESCHAEYR